MIRFVGLDVHKRETEVCILDPQGAVLHRARIPTSREALERLAAEVLSPEDRLVLEATTNTWAIVDILEPHVTQLVVSNPMRTRAIAQAKIKTDRIDAAVLANLLRADYIPPVWQPDALTRMVRRLTNHRASLVGDRTSVKNRIHSLLHERLIHCPHDQLFSKAGLAWLSALTLDELGRSMLAAELRLLAAIEQELKALDATFAGIAYQRDQAKLLMTLPGVDYVVALALLGAVGDWRRFKDGDRMASFLGLTPSVHQSGDHCYRGPITKAGNRRARWLLVQAAQHLANHPGPLGVFYRRLAHKKNHNVAVVAAAHKLAVIAWHMLKSNEPYRYAQPAATEAKLSRLRVKATGKRRRGGSPRGTPRSARYGSGQGSRCVRSLPGVLEAEGLPPLSPPREGELRHMEQAGVVRYVLSTASEQRRPKHRKTAKS